MLNFRSEPRREQIETTSLSCVCATGSTENLAPFKTYQAGYIDGTGSMTVQFTEDQSSMASRLLKSSLSKDQNGARGPSLHQHRLCCW